MGDRCTGIEETVLEDGVRAYKLIKHVTLVENNSKETWLKRCIPCQSLQISSKMFGYHEAPSILGNTFQYLVSSGIFIHLQIPFLKGVFDKRVVGGGI